MKKLLIVGYGDIARRSVPQLQSDYRLHALCRHKIEEPAAVTPIYADLDDPTSLNRVVDDWDAILHFAPPGDSTETDQRTRHLISAFKAQKILPRKLLYISTSGVYGDCGGARIDEDRPVNPGTARAKRRVDAERELRAWFPDAMTFRVPGIYAADRLPVERLKKGTPVLVDQEDVYTNHIHADDLARMCVTALERGTSGAIYNVSDDSEMKMGDWFDLIADRHNLPRPPRITRREAVERIPASLLSFMSESRRLINARIKKDLGMHLQYPTVFDGVPDRSKQ